MAQLLVLFSLLVASTLALPQFNPFRPHRCERDPILQALDDLFGKEYYISNTVDCIINQSWQKCQADQVTGCCDAVGIKLRESAPIVIRDPDVTNCPDLGCYCLKREGQELLDKLKHGRSDQGELYRSYHDKLIAHFNV